VLSVLLGLYAGFLIAAFYLHRFDIRRHHVESAWLWLAASLLVFAVLAVETADEPAPRAVTRSDRAWVVSVGLVSAWILYAPSLGVGLLSDDFVLLEKARRADFWSLGNEFFRPLPLMLWYVLSTISSGAWALHFTNVTLHGIVAGMTGLLALTFGWGRAWSVLAGVWLTVQPQLVEAVAWASGVQDLLMTVGVVSAVALLGSGVRFPAAAVMALLTAALLSKETAVAAPALLAVFWMGGSRGARGRHRRYVLLAAGVVAAYVAVRVFVASPPSEYTRVPSGYFVKELIVRPFASLAVPWHEHTITDYPILGIGLAVLPLVLLLAAASRNRAASLLHVLRCAAWVLLAIGPVYAYFFISEHLEGSRYLYLATPAWVLLLTGLLRSALGARFRWRAAVAAILVVLVSALGVVANLRPWIAAAALRDAVLREARRAGHAADCRAFTFEGLPDSVDGAYIFRNGFDQALGPLPTSPSGLDCTFRWRGSRFVRADATAVGSRSGP
jgi:hypothetical protein